jgi:hypothetical protein
MVLVALAGVVLVEVRSGQHGEGVKVGGWKR